MVRRKGGQSMSRTKGAMLPLATLSKGCTCLLDLVLRSVPVSPVARSDDFPARVAARRASGKHMGNSTCSHNLFTI